MSQLFASRVFHSHQRPWAVRTVTQIIPDQTWHPKWSHAIRCETEPASQAEVRSISFHGETRETGPSRSESDRKREKSRESSTSRNQRLGEQSRSGQGCGKVRRDWRVGARVLKERPGCKVEGIDDRVDISHEGRGNGVSSDD